MQSAADWELPPDQVERVRLLALQYAEDTTLFGDDLHEFRCRVDWKALSEQVMPTLSSEHCQEAIEYLQRYAVEYTVAPITCTALTVPSGELARGGLLEACTSLFAQYCPGSDCVVAAHLPVSSVMVTRTYFFRFLAVYKQYLSTYWCQRVEKVAAVKQSIERSYDWPIQLVTLVCTVVLSPQGPGQCQARLMMHLLQSQDGHGGH